MSSSSEGGARVALATCAEVADLDDEGRLLLAELRARGVDAAPAVWDGGTDWAALDLVVVRSTWDYAARREEFLAWARAASAVTAVANPLLLLEWSSDKHYLADLAAAGLPVVPSHFVEPGHSVEPGGSDGSDGSDGAHPLLGVEHVVKPAVSAGSKDALRLGGDEEGRSRAHVLAVLASGRSALVQPYLRAVDEVGETALVFLDGHLSHAVRKGPLLRRGAGLVHGLFAQEQLEPREPSAAEVAVGRAAVAVASERAGGAAPLYARVDLLADDDGAPRVLELELLEPSLFLDLAPGAVGRMADAVLRRLA